MRPPSRSTCLDPASMALTATASKTSRRATPLTAARFSSNRLEKDIGLLAARSGRCAVMPPASRATDTATSGRFIASERDAYDALPGSRKLAVCHRAEERVVRLVGALDKALIGAVVREIEDVERRVQLQPPDRELAAD